MNRYNFRSIDLRLGNMKKAQNFTLCPRSPESPDRQIIQSDKRIAEFNLQTGKGVLSDGKGGHQGFLKLNKCFGAVDIELSAEDLAKLRQLAGANEATGAVLIT